jgi:hypothetical protein
MNVHRALPLTSNSHHRYVDPMVPFVHSPTYIALEVFEVQSTANLLLINSKRIVNW